ncbi:hypothetical protein [Streptomyces sp. TRM72054]|uniref:hypothetical protein n=1 Tax=Streptomyces sp. TRM72054 TaxID=2870562 RepID=UPI0035AC1335
MLDRLRELSDEADVPRVTVHDLRHLAAALTITAGVPLTVVSKTLRHSTLSTTTRPHPTPPRGPQPAPLPAPPGLCATANQSRTRPATTLRPPALQERERPPSRKRENGLRPA